MENGYRRFVLKEVTPCFRKAEPNRPFNTFLSIITFQSLQSDRCRLAFLLCSSVIWRKRKVFGFIMTVRMIIYLLFTLLSNAFSFFVSFFLFCFFMELHSLPRLGSAVVCVLADSVIFHLACGLAILSGAWK